MLSSFEELYRTTASSWSKELAAEKVKVGPDQTFEQGLFQRTALATIQQSGVRVVIVLASKEDTATIAVGAQQSGMMAAGWAWAGVDTVPIVQGEAKQALDGWLYFVLAQNVSLERFHEDVRAYGERYFDQSPDSISVYAASLYDAVFLFAHAATRVISEGSDVDDGSAIVEAMTKTSFEGILQRSVELDENGDAIEPYAVMNYVEQGDGNMRGVEVCMHLHVCTHVRFRTIAQAFWTRTEERVHRVRGIVHRQIHRLTWPYHLRRCRVVLLHARVFTDGFTPGFTTRIFVVDQCAALFLRHEHVALSCKG